ncbi:hypothetical protein KIW84_046036 [Lathyrus oleraceus]|uniref:Uncharacterized protein n=1 Tax=Pisum sativum TaxID=3888 RepID=A0A9D5AY07_PEA|nr:hypothetical protein KIW84_046036 [Pisum sativum]
MEVEVKLRLANAESHHYITTLCVVSLKAKTVLVNGASHIEEDEEDLDLKVGRDCVVEPGKLSLLESRILKRVKEEFGVVGENGFLGLRGFQNMRNVYDWNNLKWKWM